MPRLLLTAASKLFDAGEEELEGVFAELEKQSGVHEIPARLRLHRRLCNRCCGLAHRADRPACRTCGLLHEPESESRAADLALPSPTHSWGSYF